MTDAYINGGYQSRDVKIYDGVTEIPWGGDPNTTSPITELQPDQLYRFDATVHRPAEGEDAPVIAYFWQFEGGVGTTGTLVGCDAKVVNAGSARGFNASANPVIQNGRFKAAPSDKHRCAVVSLSDGEQCDPASFPNDYDVPNPGAATDHSRSAWRNTHSMVVSKAFNIDLATSWPERVEELLEVRVQIVTMRVPIGWEPDPSQVENLVAQGWPPYYSFYLLPEFQFDFEQGIVSVEVTSEEAAIENLGEDNYLVLPSYWAPFTISGTVPDHAEEGDLYLVQVSAHYPAIEGITPERDIEFTEVARYQLG